LASGGGAAAVLEEHMDNATRNVLFLAGLFGVAYCVDNYAECAEVGATVFAYGSQIQQYEAHIARLNEQLALF
jgi:hypothetical protein